MNMNCVAGGYEFEEEDFVDEYDRDFHDFTNDLATSKPFFNEEEKKYLDEFRDEILTANNYYSDDLLNYFWKPKDPNFIPYLKPANETSDDQQLWFYDLKMAIKTENISLIQKFIDNGVDLKSQIDVNNMTIIDFAVACASLKSLEFILDTFQTSLDRRICHSKIGSYNLNCNDEEKIKQCRDLMLKFNIGLQLDSGKQTDGAKLTKETNETEDKEMIGIVDEMTTPTSQFENRGTSNLLRQIGLDLFIPRLADVPFLKFLMFRLDDLKNLNIKAPKTQVYMLRSILLFHAQPWNTPLLQDPIAINYMKRNELLNLLHEVEFHMSVHQCSIQYINSLLETTDEICESLENELNLNFEQIKKSKESLYKSCNKLKKKLLKALNRKSLIPPDLIVFRRETGYDKVFKWSKSVFLYVLIPTVAIYSFCKFKNSF